jgi:glycerophosphoryl diester phosphodiesterase
MTRGLRAGTLTLAVILALVSVASAAAPLIAAHRGGAALWPENSLLAFRSALALGVDALEFDLHLTRDDELVVIHDPRLERTTTATGVVRARSLAEIRSAQLKSRDGQVTAECVPTLAEVLDLVRGTTVEVLPEIKVGADGLAYPGIEEKVLAVLRARGLLGRATIQAFQPDTVRRLHALEPEARTMLLVSRRQVEGHGVSPPEAVRWARDAGASDLGMDVSLISAGVVSAARALGIRLAAWTVNDEKEITRVLELGVDLVMSDRPDLVKRLRRPQ